MKMDRVRITLSHTHTKKAQKLCDSKCENFIVSFVQKEKQSIQLIDIDNDCFDSVLNR